MLTSSADAPRTAVSYILKVRLEFFSFNLRALLTTQQVSSLFVSTHPVRESTRRASSEGVAGASARAQRESLLIYALPGCVIIGMGGGGRQRKGRNRSPVGRRRAQAVRGSGRGGGGRRAAGGVGSKSRAARPSRVCCERLLAVNARRIPSADKRRPVAVAAPAHPDPTPPTGPVHTYCLSGSRSSKAFYAFATRRPLIPAGLLLTHRGARAAAPAAAAGQGARPDKAYTQHTSIDFKTLSNTFGTGDSRFPGWRCPH
ncbi:hypothetical protein EVAR_98824_1 [Eumeta japonica]|uniref:Uncharacterized protein n=1 Tax=Eumeta variegata TaxID=151549 RepID=A0A4C1TLW1_EUMVA|nr:hypothetical protein EVAR_98824_1 [Eumeta japonica]